jgi:putative chitinase
MVTLAQFTKMFPRNKEPEQWIDVINKQFTTYGINKPRRIAAFFAQCGHETAGWTVFEENLNYSEQGLMTTFGTLVKNNAEQYANNPEKLANYVYANRIGNGDEASGDGWKFRGRGAIQLTGRANYTAFAQAVLYSDWKCLVNNPDIIFHNKYYTLLCAVWFWNAHNLSDYADKNDINSISKIINSNQRGLVKREQLYNKFLPYFM